MDELETLIESQHRRRAAAAQICVIRDDAVVFERHWGQGLDGKGRSRVTSALTPTWFQYEL